MDKVAQKQKLCETDEVVTQIVGLVSKAEAAVSGTLSLISVQSLLTLIRSASVQQDGQHRTWLKEVAAQYAVASCKLLVASVSHTRGKGFLFIFVICPMWLESRLTRILGVLWGQQGPVVYHQLGSCW